MANGMIKCKRPLFKPATVEQLIARNCLVRKVAFIIIQNPLKMLLLFLALLAGLIALIFILAYM